MLLEIYCEKSTRTNLDFPHYTQRGAVAVITGAASSACWPCRCRGAYNSSKFAVHGLTEALTSQLTEKLIDMRRTYPLFQRTVCQIGQTLHAYYLNMLMN